MKRACKLHRCTHHLRSLPVQRACVGSRHALGHAAQACSTAACCVCVRACARMCPRMRLCLCACARGTGPRYRYSLFVEPPDRSKAKWDGEPLGLEAACTVFGAHAAYPANEVCASPATCVKRPANNKACRKRCTNSGGRAHRWVWQDCSAPPSRMSTAPLGRRPLQPVHE